MKASHPRRRIRKPAPTTRRRVLVIDDNPQDRELMEAFLDAASYEVHTAEAATPGLKAATSHPPDIVLLDLLLPDLDGYEVCRRLRQEPHTQKTPIVIVTASDDPALNRLAYAAGAQACLTKPFRKEALAVVIDAVLAGTRRGRPSRDQRPPLAAADELVFPEGADTRERAVAVAKGNIDQQPDSHDQRETATHDEPGSVSDDYLVQRRFVRFPASLPVIGHAPHLDHGEILGEVRTISVGGLMVEFPVELSLSSFLDLALLTQGGPLEPEAQILWPAATRGTVRHGLAFLEPKSPDFLDKLSAGSGARAETTH